MGSIKRYLMFNFFFIIPVSSKRKINDIKDAEQELDGMLSDYEIYISDDDRETYNALLSDYDSLKHSLVSLVCASTASKTQDAYAFANGDVATCNTAVENSIRILDESISTRIEESSSARADKSVAFLLEVCVRYNTSSTTPLMRPEQARSVSRALAMGLTTEAFVFWMNPSAHGSSRPERSLLPFISVP